MSTILVVDDEISIQELVRPYLEKEGFKVESAISGNEALLRLDTVKPSLVVMDIMLPDMNGLDLCRDLRLRDDVPVLMLTARKDDIDKILGLEMGADDYLTKPFNPRELVARIRAVLRRSGGGQRPGKTVDAGNLHVDLARREVTVAGRQVKLRTKGFDLLYALAQNFGIVLTRDRLLEMIWETDCYGETRTVDMHINHVRDRITPADVEIETVRSVGYKLVKKAAD